MRLTLLILFPLALLYWFPIRRWFSRWGATPDDLTRVMAGDPLIGQPTYSGTMAITVDALPEDVWPWLVQIGYRRGGLYSYDWLDRLFGFLDRPSATRILPEFQHLTAGDRIPLGRGPSWPVAVAEPDQALVLDMRNMAGIDWVWQFGLYPVDGTRTLLVSRSRVRARTIWMRLLTLAIEPSGFLMTRRMLLGLKQRAEALAAAKGRPSAGATRPTGFKTSKGKAAYLAAYDAAMKLWPVPYQEITLPSRFGTTHVVVSGPQDAPPLVLLHGYMATLTMWSPNVAALCRGYRVYAIDVMGQPSKSLPDQPIGGAADYAEWLAATLDGLRLRRVSLMGMSYGAWLAVNFAIAAPDRLESLVLLSPGGGFVQMSRQFSLRGMLMFFVPTRFTVNSFMRWLGFEPRRGDTESRQLCDLMYLGLKHFRIPVETLRTLPVMFSADQLRSMRVPTLLLIGEHEIICDPVTALARAREYFSNLECDLVPACSHDMCSSQHGIVDARVLEFLNRQHEMPRRNIA